MAKKNQELKLSDLIDEVDSHLSEGSVAGVKMAVLEIHKVLEALLETKGYPGRTVEQKLYWAGFSLKGKDEFLAALKKEKEIQEKLEVSISDFEARETVEAYKKVIKVIAEREKLSIADQIRNFYDMYISPKSLVFWRNLAFFFAFFITIEVLAHITWGQEVVTRVVEAADFIISWQFAAIIAVFIALIFAAQYYFANKSKVRIKEDIKIKDYSE